jgi:hypothetical protein
MVHVKEKRQGSSVAFNLLAEIHNQFEVLVLCVTRDCCCRLLSYASVGIPSISMFNT